MLSIDEAIMHARKKQIKKATVGNDAQVKKIVKRVSENTNNLQSGWKS